MQPFGLRALCRLSQLHAKNHIIAVRLGRPSRLAQITRHTRFNSTQSTPKTDTSLTGKLKELSRKYGRAAILIYLGISLVDFGIAFAAVHALGTERIGAYEDALFKSIKDWTGYKKQTVNQVQQATDGVVEDTASQAHQATGAGKASLWTEAVIAYGIHKAIFIFIRIPITVAITPSIVKGLVKRGWKIGPAAAAAAATETASKGKPL